MNPSSLVLSQQTHECTTFITPTAWPAGTKSETPPRGLRYWLYSHLFEVQHNADKEMKLLNRDKSSTTTLRMRSDAFSHWSTRLCWPPKDVNIGCGLNGCGGVLQIILTRPWTLSLHLDNISHCNDWTRQNIKRDIFRPCISSDQSCAALRTHGGRLTTNPSSNTANRNSTAVNDQPGQRALLEKMGNRKNNTA